ncbi:MAG: rhodanese-related sulfurtransferase, partial [Gammaproteobacteria bacterium]
YPIDPEFIDMSRIKEISAAELSQLIQINDALELVDIRTQAEIERGVIPNAKTLPMHLVPLNLDYFSSTQNQIVIYCRTGSRSAQVCRFLNQQGFNNAINLRGGIVKWASSGLPMAAEASGLIA